MSNASVRLPFQERRTEAPNNRSKPRMDVRGQQLHKECDSLAGLAEIIGHAAGLGFRDVTVTTVTNRPDRDAGERKVTRYIVDFHENAVPLEELRSLHSDEAEVAA